MDVRNEYRFEAVSAGVRQACGSTMLDAIPDATSLSLIDRVQRHDQEAWRRLAAIYGPCVYAWCRKAGLQPADAADVVQEVFCAVIGHIEQFHHDRVEDSFRGWLARIFRNKVNDFMRRRRVQPPAAGGSAVHGVIERWACPSDALSAPDAQNDNDQLVHRALLIIRHDFQERTWEAFSRCVLDGERPGNVASDLGMSIAAVCMCRARVLTRLRETLAGLGFRIDH